MQQASSRSTTNPPHLQPRTPTDLRSRNGFAAHSNGAMPIPQAPPIYNGAHRTEGMTPGPPTYMGRSPPNPPKNTRHVPCKFFLQGNCQAGAACPFLHSSDSSAEVAPCKYFSKGNCKFGAKCALAHILPDGRRVNKPSQLQSQSMGMGINLNGGGGPLNLGGRVEPTTYLNTDSALATSIITHQHSTDTYAGPYLYPGQDEVGMGSDRHPPYQTIPSTETGLSSNPGSKYGSPVDDSRLPVSPAGRHLTALDAPMPASFDSNGISHIARYGAVAASVPSKFGMESPPASLPKKTGFILDAFKATRNPSFGSNARNNAYLGTSPPLVADESIGQRLMHSQPVSKPRTLSASLPRTSAAEDWEDSLTLDEVMLPTTLRDDVMTPQEKMRRLSRPDQDPGIPKDSTADFRIPSGSSSKVGSPLASSPSRFSALFAKQRKEKEQEGSSGLNSAFGHVGSPLRESSLSDAFTLQPMNSKPNSDEQFAALSSPPRNPPTSMIAQMHRMQLQRTESGDSSNRLQPGSARHSNVTGRFDRAVSSPGLGSTRIDEESADMVFSMDEEGSKRNSSIWGSKSPNLRPLGEGPNESLPTINPTKTRTDAVEDMYVVRS